MCTTSCIEFGASNLVKEEIENKRVIEVGSLDVGGSLRHYVISHKPSEYIGVDIQEGPGVDVLCDVNRMRDIFENDSFDLVISTELLEHIREWRLAVSNIKRICKPGGIILITTRSHGFHYHGYPHDYWRYDAEDMKSIFSDLTIKKLEKDRVCPGVFMKAEKPDGFRENDLSQHKLYSIIANKRLQDIDDKNVRRFQANYKKFETFKKKINKFEKVTHRICKYILFRRQDYIA